MDKDLKILIKNEVAKIISEELELRFKPIQEQINLILKSNDAIAEQIREDRKDINQLKIDQATANKQNKVIIENQNTQEEALVKTVKEEVEKIPTQVEKSVDKMFEHKPFLKRLQEKIRK